MADPALNSVYLEAPRREEFRRARQALFAARGSQTVCLEAQRWAEPRPSPTLGALPQAADATQQTGLCVLVEGRPQPLKVGVNTVGRLPENDVVVADAHVSRRHCAIVVHAGCQCEVHDMASKNGTLLNGARITGPTSLKAGDEIGLGEFRLVFLGTDLQSEAEQGGQTQVIRE